MKKFLIVFLTVAAVFFAATAGVLADQSINIFVQNEKMQFPDVKPFEQGNSIMVPLRAFCEHYTVQYEVQWNPMAKTVIAQNSDYTAKFTIGQKDILVTNEETGMTKIIPSSTDVEITKTGRTIVPLEVVAEVLAFDIVSQDAISIHMIETPGSIHRTMAWPSWQKVIDRQQ